MNRFSVKWNDAGDFATRQEAEKFIQDKLAAGYYGYTFGMITENIAKVVKGQVPFVVEDLVPVEVKATETVLDLTSLEVKEVPADPFPSGTVGDLVADQIKAEEVKEVKSPLSTTAPSQDATVNIAAQPQPEIKPYTPAKPSYNPYSYYGGY